MSVSNVQFHPSIVSGGRFSSALQRRFNVVGEHGQSQIRGQAGARPGIDDDYTGLENVYMYDHARGLILPARNPLPHQDPVPGSTGCWHRFAQLMDKSEPILIVPGARGATGLLTHQSKGQAVYNEFVARMRAVMNMNPANKLIGFLTALGNTDAENQNVNFLSQYIQMRKDLIADIPGLTEDTPWITASIGSSSAWGDTINLKLQEFVAQTPAARYVDLEDLPRMDGTHFTAAGLQTMGERMFYAFQDAVA